MTTRLPRKIRAPVTVVLISTFLLALEAWSQEQPTPVPPVTKGSRIRVRAPTSVQGPIQGTVIEMDDKSLLIDVDTTDAHSRVSREAITQLELGTGHRRQTKKGALIGGGIGVAFGALVALAGEPSGDNPFCNTKASCAGLGGGLFGAMGAAAGAGIGALIKSDRWTRVPVDRVRVSLAPTRGHGVRLSVSVGF